MKNIHSMINYLRLYQKYTHMNLPKEIWQIIFNKSCFISKIRVRTCCRLLYQILEINDFYNIDECYLMKLTDDIILKIQYYHVKSIKQSKNNR